MADPGVLAAALTSASPVTRIAARAMGSEWTRLMAVWLNDELDRNAGERRADVLHALADVQAQVYASLMAQLLTPRGDAAAIELYVGLIQSRVPLAAAAIRKAMEARP